MTPGYVTEALERVGVLLIRHAHDRQTTEDRLFLIDSALTQLGVVREELALEPSRAGGGRPGA